MVRFRESGAIEEIVDFDVDKNHSSSDTLMSPDQQCGGTEEAKKKSQEQGQLFKIINQNIMKYNEILEELQKYNLDMNAKVA